MCAPRYVRVMLANLSSILVAAGVEPTRANGMHALRHHHASVLLDAGVSIRALAEHLGHADPGFTLRTYTHLMPRARSLSCSRLAGGSRSCSARNPPRS